MLLPIYFFSCAAYFVPKKKTKSSCCHDNVKKWLQIKKTQGPTLTNCSVTKLHISFYYKNWYKNWRMYIHRHHQLFLNDLKVLLPLPPPQLLPPKPLVQKKKSFKKVNLFLIPLLEKKHNIKHAKFERRKVTRVLLPLTFPLAGITLYFRIRKKKKILAMDTIHHQSVIKIARVSIYFFLQAF